MTLSEKDTDGEEDKSHYDFRPSVLTWLTVASSGQLRPA